MKLYLHHAPILQFIVTDYADHCSKTREETLEYLTTDTPTSKRIQNAFNAFREARRVYPFTIDNLLSGERVPLIEANETSEILLFLLFSGVYKPSFQLLRELLELVLLQFHIHLDYDKHFLDAWLKGEYDTPYKATLKGNLSKSEFYRLANAHLDLDTQLDRLYDVLCGYTHTQGITRSHQTLKTSNRPGFFKITLQEFSKVYFDTIKYCVSLIAIHFPNAIIPLPVFKKFGYGGPIYFIDQDQVEMVRTIFNDTELSILEHLAANNQAFQELKSAVEVMPDLTKEEIDKSYS